MKINVAILMIVACSVVTIAGCDTEIDVEERVDGSHSVEEIEEFVMSAKNEEISVDEAEEFLESLNEDEFDDFVSVVEGVVQYETRSPMIENDIELASSDEEIQPRSGWSGEHIENVWTWGIPSGSAWAYGYNVSYYCDGSDPDKEYQFNFSFPAHTPSAIRWTTTSAWIYTVFKAYDNNLWGSGSLLASGSSQTVRLCIGDKGVLAAGGPSHVKSRVFIHY